MLSGIDGVEHHRLSFALQKEKKTKLEKKDKK